MPGLAEITATGGLSWLLLPSAVLLGALHGLEPGHSKTMMAAFIIAIRGTVAQAVMLGLAATVSHTAIVWVIALGGLYLWRGVDAERIEPHLPIVSSTIILALSAWMMARARSESTVVGHHHHHHDHDHDHVHDHHHDHDHDHGHGHHHHAHGPDHHHHHHHDGHGRGAVAQDAHQREHARQIEQRFSGGAVTNWQILAFGLTGGLIPCPAAITVLLLCLQLREIALGAGLVLGFSVGLAITLVAVGAAAALGAGAAARRLPGLSAWAARMPYLSGAVMSLVGLYMIAIGVIALAR